MKAKSIKAKLHLRLPAKLCLTRTGLVCRAFVFAAFAWLKNVQLPHKNPNQTEPTQRREWVRTKLLATNAGSLPSALLHGWLPTTKA